MFFPESEFQFSVSAKTSHLLSTLTLCFSKQKSNELPIISTMLKPKTLTQILSQVNTSGICATLLFNKDGRLLAFAGNGDKEIRMIAAIASGVWASYNNYGKSVLAESQLQDVYIDAERGSAMISVVADVLLCLYSKDSSPKVDIGMMKQKMKALAEHLEKPLSQLSGI